MGVSALHLSDVAARVRVAGYLTSASGEVWPFGRPPPQPRTLMTSTSRGKRRPRQEQGRRLSLDVLLQSWRSDLFTNETQNCVGWSTKAEADAVTNRAHNGSLCHVLCLATFSICQVRFPT